MKTKIIIGFIVFCAFIEIVSRLVGGENAEDIGYAIGSAVAPFIVFALFDYLVYWIAKWVQRQNNGTRILGNIVAGFLGICVGVLLFWMTFDGAFGNIPIALSVALSITELCVLGFIFYKVHNYADYGNKETQTKLFSTSKNPLASMDGHDFEHFCADILRLNGFVQVRVTPASGDQGVDILAEKDGLKFAVQCKKWSSPIGNTAIQEVSAGRAFYQCDIAVVLTNSTFTKGAVELAKATGVLLWDGDKLNGLIHNATHPLS